MKSISLKERWDYKESIGVMPLNTEEEKEEARKAVERINHQIYGDNIPDYVKPEW